MKLYSIFAAALSVLASPCWSNPAATAPVDASPVLTIPTDWKEVKASALEVKTDMLDRYSEQRPGAVIFGKAVAHIWDTLEHLQTSLSSGRPSQAGGP